MNKNAKIWLISATCLIIVGSFIFGGVMMTLKWDFNKITTNKLTNTTHELNGDFNSISIFTDTADIALVPCDDANPSVLCVEHEKQKHSVSVEENTLIIRASDTRKWYEHIGINFHSPEITVYIPQGDYRTLSIESATGDIDIPKCFNFKSIHISESTGKVTCHASASDSINIKTTTGNIHVENISAGAVDLSVSTGDIKASKISCTDSVTINVSTGKTFINDVSCKSFTSKGSTGDIFLTNVIVKDKLFVKRTTGDIKLEASDSAEAFIETSTGDVKGTLLTGKKFVTKTSTGTIDIPFSTSGGVCEITTSTGDIKIEVLEIQ